MSSPSLDSNRHARGSYRDVLSFVKSGKFSVITSPNIFFFSFTVSSPSGALMMWMLDLFLLTHGSLSLFIFLKIFLLCSYGKFFIEILQVHWFFLCHLYSFEPVQWSFKFWSLYFSVLKFPLVSSLYVLLFYWNFLFFYLRMFPIVCWRRYIIAVLKSLSDNTKIWVMLVLSINCPFLCKIRFSWLYAPWVILAYSLDILHFIFWNSGSC